MTRLILFTSTLLLYLCATAQTPADKWYFGMNAGIDFTGIPTASNGAIATTEGTASISDSAGNLLFYTDGISVWNKNHQVMQNGNGLMGGISSTTSALIVPYPGNASLYYLFTLDESQSTNGFRYSLVDMTLDSNLGDVTTKNVLIKGNVTEKMTAVRQPGKDIFWVVVHEWGSNNFFAYKIDGGGLQLTTPVISAAGLVHRIDANEQNKYGQMKFNPCGTRLALAIGYMDTVEVMDFNTLTGIVTPYVTIPMGNHVYGIEMSRSGNALYVSSYNSATGYAYIDQFDLDLLSPSLVISSKYNVSTDNSGTVTYYGMQLGPDGKIYVARSWSQFLGVIANPSILGSGSAFTDLGFDLDPNAMGYTGALGLPAFVQSFLKDDLICPGDSVTGFKEQGNIGVLQVYPNPTTGFFMLRLSVEGGPYSVNIFNMMGKVMETHLDLAGEVAVGHTLPGGTYIAVVRGSEGVTTGKLVKW